RLQLVVGHALGGEACRVRLEQQPELVELLELAAVQPRCRAIADEMLLHDETRRLEPAQRFANRRLRHAELAREIVDRDARVRRYSQRNDVRADQLVDVLHDTLRALDPAGWARRRTAWSGWHSVLVLSARP